METNGSPSSNGIVARGEQRGCAAQQTLLGDYGRVGLPLVALGKGQGALTPLRTLCCSKIWAAQENQ